MDTTTIDAQWAANILCRVRMETRMQWLADRLAETDSCPVFGDKDKCPIKSQRPCSLCWTDASLNETTDRIAG